MEWGIASLREFFRGWVAHMNGECKRKKTLILDHLNNMDRVAEERDLNADEWTVRYTAEKELEKIYEMEERY